MEIMRARKSNSGYSLVEVMVAAAIGIIVLGAAMAMVQPMLRLKNQLDTNSGLYTATMYMRDCISNDDAWKNTVILNGIACLMPNATNSPCTSGAGNEISLMGADLPGVAATTSAPFCLANYDTAASATSNTGFTKEGTVCTGFSATGNDQCPYRMNLVWYALCPFPGDTTCTNPLVTIRGDMVYSPGPVGKANPQSTQVNLGKYQINVVRGRADQNRFFSIAETRASGTAAGTCAANGTVARNFKPAVVNDPGGYVHNSATLSDTIVLEAGTYDCQISVPGYAVGSFRAFLTNKSSGAILLVGSSEYSPAVYGNVAARSMISGTFTLNSPKNELQVAEWCSSLPFDPTNTLGVPASMPSSVEVYTTMHCNVLAQTQSRAPK